VLQAGAGRPNQSAEGYFCLVLQTQMLTYPCDSHAILPEKILVQASVDKDFWTYICRRPSSKFWYLTINDQRQV